MYLPAILLFYYFIILINTISLELILFDVANFQVQSQYKINVQQSIASKSLQNFLLYITISIISHYFQQFHNTLQNTIYKSFTKINNLSPSRNSPLHLNNPPTSPGILNSHKISSIRLFTVCTQDKIPPLSSSSSILSQPSSKRGVKVGRAINQKFFGQLVGQVCRAGCVSSSLSSPRSFKSI